MSNHIFYFHSCSATKAHSNATDDVVDMTNEPIKTCEGVFPAFRTDKYLKATLQNYAIYCAVAVTSDYIMDTFGNYHQVYHHSCDGKGGVMRTKKHSHRACDKNAMH